MGRLVEGGTEPAPDQGLDRRTLILRAGSLGLAVSGLGLLEACGSSDEPVRGVATTLRIRNAAGEPARIDPIYPTSDGEIRRSLFEGLIGNPLAGGDPINILAERFELSDDRRAFDFTLKRGVKFHQGFGEVKAEDVKFSLERAAGITKSKEPSGVSGLFGDIKRVDVRDEYSGRIVLKQPSATLLTTGLGEFGGVILSKKAFTELGEKGHFANPVGTGPYQFDSWKRGRAITLATFSDYAGSAPYVPKARFKTLVYSFIANDTAAEAAFDTGQLDFLNIPATAKERFEGKQDAAVFEKTGMEYTWIGMNVLDPALKNRNLRLAIRAAIDVPAIVQAIGGDKPRANAMVAPSAPIGYWEDAPVHDRDLDQARQLLQSVPAADRKLTFTIANDEQSKTVAQVAQQNLAEVGISIKIVPLDGGSFYVTGAENRKRQLFYAAFGAIYAEPSQEFFYHTCAQLDIWNYDYWCDKQFDSLLKQSALEFDRDARNETYIEMQRIWEEAATSVWISYGVNHYAARRSVVEPAFAPSGSLFPQAAKPV